MTRFGALDAYAHEVLTISSSPVPLTSTLRVMPDPIFPGGAICQAVWITVEDEPVRVRIDGGNPTTTVGHLLQTGDDLFLEGEASLDEFAAIAIDGNATLQVTYFR